LHHPSDLCLSGKTLGRLFRFALLTSFQLFLFAMIRYNTGSLVRRAFSQDERVRIVQAVHCFKAGYCAFPLMRVHTETTSHFRTTASQIEKQKKFCGSDSVKHFFVRY
jgi:hypothetical protein